MSKFSVIIPLYNKASYLRKALDSVLAQTFTDYECIIVDDGSTDHSKAVAEQWIAEKANPPVLPVRSRFRLVHQENAGVGAARNRGIAESTGGYVAFLDADDWWEPQFLEEQQRMIASYPDAGIWATNYVYYKIGKTHVALDIPTGYFDYSRVYVDGAAMPVWTGAVCMMKRVAEEMGGFPVNIKLGEDFLLWSKIALRYPVVFLNNPLAYYNNEVPTTLRATRHLYAPECHMLWHMEYIPEEGDWKRLKDKLRVIGLLDYWMSREYHKQAAIELQKVDWTSQSASVVKAYRLPLWYLRFRKQLLQYGSQCKQIVRKLIYTMQNEKYKSNY